MGSGPPGWSTAAPAANDLSIFFERVRTTLLVIKITHNLLLVTVYMVISSIDKTAADYLCLVTCALCCVQNLIKHFFKLQMIGLPNIQ